MFTKFKTRNRIRDSTKTMMIAVLVTSMMFMTASIYTNQTNDSKALVYAQSSNESNEYGSTSDSNVSLINTTSNMISPTITISTSKSIEKEFWINTMHLDGNTNVKAGTKCDTCPQ